MAITKADRTYDIAVRGSADLAFIISALYVAAEQYEKDAITVAYHEQLAEQFKRQAEDVRRIIENLEDQT
jgi:hypothetical protein